MLDTKKTLDCSPSAESTQRRMPVVSLPHGGGPWPFVDLGMRPAEVRELSDYLRALPSLPAEKPKALLVVSAHWEAEVPTVMTGAQPPLYFDYYGFPKRPMRCAGQHPGHPGWRRGCVRC